MFQAAMAELGVEVKVEELELATWIDRIVTTDDYDISWDYHFHRAVDPACTLSLAFFYPPGPQNICRYQDDEIASLITQGGDELDQDKRNRSTISSRSAGTSCNPASSSANTRSSTRSPRMSMGFYTDPLLFQDFRRSGSTANPSPL